MPRSQSEAEFDQLLLQDQQTLMASRGAKSQFAPLEVPDGTYFGQLIGTARSVVSMETKFPEGHPEAGKKTGYKEKVKKIEIKCIFLADKNPRCEANELEMWAGQPGSITFLLAQGDKAASDRMCATLGEMGIPTDQFVPTEADIQDPNTQLTLQQGLAMIDYEKPYCVLAVSTSGQARYVNFRGKAEKEEIERLVGHPINTSFYVEGVEGVDQSTAAYDPNVQAAGGYVDPNQAPFDPNAGAEIPAGQPHVEWQEQHGLFQTFDDNTQQFIDEWWDRDGNPAASPIPPTSPAKPQFNRAGAALPPPNTRPSPATANRPPAAAPAARPAAPAARPTPGAARPGAPRALRPPR